jgi:alkylated DNA repair dioxygenase AlkB
MPETDAIPGLRYVPEYISGGEQSELLATIDAQPWRDDLKRRVQHYGYRYDYARRNVDRTLYLGELPSWLQRLVERLRTQGLMPEGADQVIVNEYQPGQGIAPHVDSVTSFHAPIASLSLGSACVMDFSHPAAEQRVPILLQPCSLVLLDGAARHEWRHGIAARRSDEYGAIRLERGRRVSLTFRRVILAAE